MIESLRLSNVATYNASGIEINNLKKINFFYGSNGCGKTTLSKYLANTSSSEFINCSLSWKNNQPLNTFVYNKDFREKNFSNSHIAGVFTLGQDSIETIQNIHDKKTNQENLENLIGTRLITLNKAKEDLNNYNQELLEKCWELYKKYEDDFKAGLKGYQKKELFKNKIISTLQSISEDTVFCTYEELKTTSGLVLSEEKFELNLLTKLSTNGIREAEEDEIWEKCLVGKSDVDLAALIESLGCQDWVSHGRKYILDSNVCPFCQNETITDSFRNKIGDFFDKSFEDRVNTLKKLECNYKLTMFNLIGGLNQIIEREKSNEDTKLRVNELERHLEILNKNIENNLLLIDKKIQKPSEKIVLNSNISVINDINNLINEANDSISKHNFVIRNFFEEKTKFTQNLWLFLAKEIQNNVQSNQRRISGKEKAISSLELNLTKTQESINSIKVEILELSSSITSVQPTVDQINSQLKAYGFLSFEIVPSTQLNNHYVIQRQNGELAYTSLSEGEETFITFLYFMQLAKGAFSESDVALNRIIVIDDPISSLDSNVLYIVSAIIKKIIREVKNDSNIKQLLILTHNIYFHKEASFQNGRSNGCVDTNYWMLRKNNNITSVQAYSQTNPISSSYELMWRELSNRTNRSAISIQNIMRRILENYFKVLGKIEDEDIISKFDNHEEQQVCSSLFHWINDGSHCIPDDLFIQSSDDQIDNYLRVFKEIFKKLGHEAHYQMMMGGEELFDGEFDENMQAQQLVGEEITEILQLEEA